MAISQLPTELHAKILQESDFPQFASLAQTCRQLQHVCGYILNRRENQLFEYFELGNQKDAIFRATHEGDGGLFGMSAVFLTEKAPNWFPSALHFMVTDEVLPDIEIALVQAGYGDTPRSRDLEPRVLSVRTSRYAEYFPDDSEDRFFEYTYEKLPGPSNAREKKLPSKKVSIITVRRPGHIIAALLLQTHSLDACFYSGRVFFTPFPETFFSRQSLLRTGGSGVQLLGPYIVDLRLKLAHCGFKLVTFVRGSKDESGCGGQCGSILRSVRGASGFWIATLRAESYCATEWGVNKLARCAVNGFIDQDGEYSYLFQWSRCNNIACGFFGHGAFIYSRHVPLVLSTENPKRRRIETINHMVLHAIPSFPKLVNAVLFASGVSQPLFVAVPCLRRARTVHTIDDVVTSLYTWPNPSRRSTRGLMYTHPLAFKGSVTRAERNTVHLQSSRLPDLTIVLVFSIDAESQTENEILNTGRSKDTRPLNGDVLVVLLADDNQPVDAAIAGVNVLASIIKESWAYWNAVEGSESNPIVLDE